MESESAERRRTCGQHGDTIKELGECKKALKDGDARMQGIEDKIDTMMVRQMGYIEGQTTISVDVTRIKAIVENGLRKNVEELSIAAIAVHDKVELLKDFTWFINTVNGLRDGLMKKLIIASLFGGVLVVFYSALSVISTRGIPKLLEKLW